MKTFEANIIATYGKKGKLWLAQLPEMVQSRADEWGLSDLKPVSNLTYNYVLSGLNADQPVILKLCCDKQEMKRELSALRAFSGLGAVQVLGQADRALLLQRAVPGTSLKSYFPHKDLEAARITPDLMIQLHKAPFSPDEFPHIRDWLSILDKNWDIPERYLQKARQLRDQLLASMPEPVLLHGDLHHDNILQHGQNWLAIDPKGVIGEPAYEAGAFIRNPLSELLASTDVQDYLAKRIAFFAKAFNIESQRMWQWCFVQAVLAWVWDLEGGKDSHFKQLTDIFATI